MPTVEDTDWPQILTLYQVLQRIDDNPVVTLNRAVATAMVHGLRAGLALLDTLDTDDRMADSHRLPAVRAHLLDRAGQYGAAVDQYRAAARRTTSGAERDYRLRQADRLHRGPRGLSNGLG